MLPKPATLDSGAWNDPEEAEDQVFLGGFDRIEKRTQTRARQQEAKRYLHYVGIAVGIAIAAGILIGIMVSAAKREALPWSCPSDPAAYGLTFFVIGDWGRQGNAHQRQAALIMADVAQCMPPGFIVSSGDNFYEQGLTSDQDPQIDASWRNVYNAPSLQVPWYATLGNHDYGNNAGGRCKAATLEACPEDCCYSPVWQYTGRVNDARWNCQNGTWRVPAAGPLADIIMMDTSPMIRRYWQSDWADHAAGLSSQDPNATAAAALGLLASSTAPWKLVVGHHPIRSYGEHCDFDNKGDCTDMAPWTTRLQDKGAAVYFCGHEHNLQYISPTADGSAASLSYVVTGAGSDVRHNEFSARSDWPADLRFAADDQGFVAVRVNETALVMHFYTSSKGTPSFTKVLTR